MKLKGTSKVLNRLKRASSEATLQTKSAVVRNTDGIFKDALSDVPVDMGYLRSSGIPSYTDNQLKGTVSFGGASAPYAPYVEFGTGKAAIIPQGFSDFAMEFYVNGEGNMKPQPYLIPAFIKYKKIFLKDLRKIAKNISK
jgi:HK97 gp10 family phage protein